MAAPRAPLALRKRLLIMKSPLVALFNEGLSEICFGEGQDPDGRL